MVDIHCHFLPSMDDGAIDEAESAEMLALAARTGTADLVATPHADTQYRYDIEAVEAALAVARGAAPDGLRLHRGCDFHLMHDNVQRALAEPGRYTINGGRYLLVEFSDLVIFENTGEVFERLESAGLTMIVTHPERNPLLRQRIELLAEWVGAGRLMQLTAGSLLGQWGRKAQDFSRLMLDRGLAHFVASDGHDARARQPRLDRASEWLARNLSRELADLLTEDHPRAVIDNRRIDLAVFPPRPQGRKSWFGRIFGSGQPDPAD
jgi:protein-tyrosine phosphatase